ncbi:Hypothetical protein PHPALM_5668 [Phytophthora palmivora]|uniref:Uncharacterized protein n=1 Tax=Phytophthora palmivora TaxID=4796 RepID=A0A2P4YGT1_9STRA|nr:Hypothetical protein PHPALM_5668 [Phytophthora palmivora]
MDEEDESEFDLGGGPTGGRSPSPDQASTPPSKDVGSSRSSGEVIEVGSGSDEEEEEEEEENAEVADDLYEAQTLMALKREEANVKALQAAEPWRVIRNTLPPISFEADVGGRLGIFVRQYRDFEASELIAYWESTHKFPITAAMIAQSPWLGSFAKQRNNRRSHAGNRWKRMLLTLIQAMIEGWCDLDLLLDPFFLHFPKHATWAMCNIRVGANLENIKEVVRMGVLQSFCPLLDEWEDPMVELVILEAADHPARHLPRLDRKFFGLQVAQPPTSS